MSISEGRARRGRQQGLTWAVAYPYAGPRLRTDMVRQIRRNRGFSTANLAQATDTPGGMWPWVGNRPRNAGSRRWSIPTTPGTTTHPEGAAASKELDGGLRPSG